jgi:SAM-dependent methyltransferase
MTRFELAAMVNDDVVPCKHEDFEGIAPRPRDTSFVGEPDAAFRGKLLRMVRHPLNDRVVELSLFFGIPIDKVAEKLAGGFLPLHEAVSEDFREFMRKCKSPHSSRVRTHDAELLDWYRTTEAYIWELSAYHEDEGFNYAGMCAGIVQCLKSNSCKRVLCLGDGIGDLTLALHRAGLEPTYHDLLGSRTADYAWFRFWRQTGKRMPQRLSNENVLPWLMPASLDAIIALDYFEHLPNLPEWIRACHAAMKPGGLMMAKNAFGKGSGDDGAMPMHLTVNDQYADEAAWVDLCVESGFTLYDPATPDWWRKV